MFREGIRKVPLMNELTKGISNNDLKALAEAIAKLPPPSPPTDTPDAARMEAARTLSEQNRCNICHGGTYAGGENVPRIAGQREDYLLKTLREYKKTRAVVTMPRCRMCCTRWTTNSWSSWRTFWRARSSSVV